MGRTVVFSHDGKFDFKLGNALLGGFEPAVGDLVLLLGDFLVEETNLKLVGEVGELVLELVALGAKVFVLRSTRERRTWRGRGCGGYEPAFLVHGPQPTVL